MTDDSRAFDLDQQPWHGEARDPDDRLRRMIGPAGDRVDRRRDRLVLGRVEGVDRSADDVIPRLPGGRERRLDVSHRRARLVAEIVVADDSEFAVERDLACEVDDSCPLGNRDVAEPGRRVELRRVDELPVM
jgi:hypothetical protein